MTDRAKVIRVLEESVPFLERIGYSGIGYAVHDALELLQAPEIVRCKDCVYATHIFEPGTLPYIICCGVAREPDWFCADGKRRMTHETD